MRRSRPAALPLAVAGVCAGALTACGGDDAPATIDVTQPGVVSVNTVEEAFGLFGRLSPDGRFIASFGADGLCLVETATGGTPRCTDLEGAPERSSVRWTPDAAKLVFVDDFVRQQVEPDIWVLDTETMQLDNVTDDGVAAIDDDSAAADVAATWMPDGSIVFVRIDLTGDTHTLMRWHADGALDEIGELDIDGSFAIYLPMFALSDDEVLAATSVLGEDAELLRIDVETAAIERVANIDEEYGGFEIADVTADGATALIVFTSRLRTNAVRSEDPLHAVIDLETGVRHDVLPAGIEVGEGRPFQPAGAILTPDGRAVVMARAADPGLYVVSLEAVAGEPTSDDLVNVATLDGAGDGGDGEPSWGLESPFGWTADGQLVGLVGVDQVARITFTDE